MLKRLATPPVQVIWVFGLILAGHILVGGGADAAPDRERRIALVIGNGAYEATSPLNNPVPDARLIADTLRSLDFEVAERLDVGQIEMKRAIRDFGELLYEAGQDAIGLFYYSGHAVQVNGRNYMIPVEAKIDRESDVDTVAVDANIVLA